MPRIVKSTLIRKSLPLRGVTDQVGVRVITEGRVSDLTASGERLRLSVTPLARALGVLGDRVSLDGEAVVAAIARSETPTVIRALVEAGVEIEEARWIGADLEDVFMTETGWTGVQAGAAKGTAHAG